MSDWFETSLRVRYSETDAMGLLHHANYVSYFEVARTEMLRSAGGDYRAMEERGYFLVVVKIEVQYKRPARFDDVLRLRCRVVRNSGAKLEHEYEIFRGEELLTTGRSILACVNHEGQVQRITEDLLYGR